MHMESERDPLLDPLLVEFIREVNYFSRVRNVPVVDIYRIVLTPALALPDLVIVKRLVAEYTFNNLRDDDKMAITQRMHKRFDSWWASEEKAVKHAYDKLLHTLRATLGPGQDKQQAHNSVSALKDKSPVPLKGDSTSDELYAQQQAPRGSILSSGTRKKANQI